MGVGLAKCQTIIQRHNGEIFCCGGQAAPVDLSQRFADPTAFLTLARPRGLREPKAMCLQPRGGQTRTATPRQARPGGSAAAYLAWAKADLWGKLVAIAVGGTQGCPEAGLGISPSGRGPIRE
jgi:hypothetical protein